MCLLGKWMILNKQFQHNIYDFYQNDTFGLVEMKLLKFLYIFYFSRKISASPFSCYVSYIIHVTTDSLFKKNL